MNTDIRLMLSFRNHPKSKKVRLKLGEGGVLGFIYLLMFAAESKPDGVLDGMDEDDIALAADYREDPQEFCDVLVAVRFLDFDGETYSIHDWRDNNPWAAGARDRSEKARYAANVRHGNEPPPKTENQTLTEKNDAPSTDETCAEQETALPPAQDSNAPSPFLSFPSPSPSPSPTPKSKPSVESASGPDGDVVNRIFEYWQEAHNHPRAKLDDKRRKKIQDRLANGYSEDDLLAAIRGCKKSPHHMGKNDSGTVYDDLELICRDGPHVDKFIRLDAEPDTTRMSGSARKTSSAAQKWLEAEHAEQR